MVRSGWPVVGWGVVYAGFGAGCAVGGVALFGAPRLGWLVAGVGAAAAAAGVAVRRRPAWRPVLWPFCGLAAVAAWGLLMDVLALLFGQAVDSVAGAVQHALAAAGALLLGSAARRRGPAAARTVAPSEAPAAVQLAAWAGTLAFGPYVAMKSLWAFGGSFAGIDGDEMDAMYARDGASGLWRTLESWGIDGTVLLAALGVFLLWGLVRPWGQVFPRWAPGLCGRRVPRWLPLAPALVGAATLAPYGVAGIGYLALCTTGVLDVRRGGFSSGAEALQVGWVGAVAFAGYGVALAVATRSYWRRTGG
ncbi:hypothetical protein ACIRS1_32850 [Kitasatospora sp. NPDC101176]|uniref:hypothetical protein n=1 Tax=Kitasatospora sp. NPDC101176 TaxID=3364099 RepID=UPI0037FD98CE